MPNVHQTQYEEQIAHIRQTLEEREREDMFRLKRIKAKKATG